MENLLLRYYEGETTEDETALIKEWLEASEENRRTARQVQTLGLAADMAQIRSRLDCLTELGEEIRREQRRMAELSVEMVQRLAREEEAVAQAHRRLDRFVN